MNNTINEKLVTVEALKEQIEIYENRKNEIPDEIYDYFKANYDEFSEVYEELDGWIDCIEFDDKYYNMSEISEFFYHDPHEALMRAYYGEDEDGDAFCPNRDYFRFNGYGNLYSCDCKDYSDYLSDIAVYEIIENAGNIDLPYEVENLIDEYDDIENEIETLES